MVPPPDDDPAEEVQVDESETSQASEATVPAPRHDRIFRAMKRARKAAGPDFDENEEKVGFLIAEARILATLEVADALRGDQNDAGS
jgi:hypothetical protein